MSKNTVLFGPAFATALLLTAGCATAGDPAQQDGRIVCNTSECAEGTSDAFSITEESNGTFNLGGTTVVPLIPEDKMQEVLEDARVDDFQPEDGEKVVGTPDIGLP